MSARKKRSNSGDLFPELLPAVLPARFPTVGTRAWDALIALIEAPRNQFDYIHSHGCWRLGAYVQDLEELGWVFSVRDIEKPHCRAPIAEYALRKSHLAVRKGLAAYRRKVVRK